MTAQVKMRILPLLEAKMGGWRNHLWTRILIGIVFFLVLGLLFPGGSTLDIQYKVGSIWTERDLTAPFSFPVYKDESDYQSELRTAAQSVLPVYQWNDRIGGRQLDSLASLFDRIAGYFRDRRSGLRLTASTDSAALALRMKEIGLRLSERDWEILATLKPSGTSIESLRRTIAQILDGIYETGVINQHKERIPTTAIALRRNIEEQLVPRTRFLDINDAAGRLQHGLVTVFHGDDDTVAMAYKIGLSFLQPNIIFNRTETDKSIEAAHSQVPRTVGIVQDGEVIVSRGQRITDDIRLKLDSFKKFWTERGGAEQSFAQYFGKVIHSAIIFILFVLYLSLFRQKIINDSAMIILIALIVLFEAFLARLSMALDVGVPIEYLIFVPTASMILTIAFDSRVGFYGTVAIGMIVGGIRGNDYAIVLASIAAGGLSVYTVRSITHRTQIFRSIGYIFIGYGLTIIALALERTDSFSAVMSEMTIAGANAVFSPVLTYGLLLVVERVFKITTELRLLDLADDNHPLLRELSAKAPGTFHHSMAMGILAESAAEAIGANALLARVGAYYHDIGKTEMPEYFVENQESKKSKHDRLKPRMSALIVISHVKEGMELARKYGLPEQVIDIIPQHHGTTLISYFYHKAQRRRTSKEEVNENDYRYPGPKPQTKEAGIVMLADGIEASVRALDDPTPPRIEDQIDSIIKGRFNDGQLDDCDLTFNDLTKIKEAFLRALIGIHHARIKYPSAEDTLAAERETPVEEPAAGEPEQKEEHRENGETEPPEDGTERPSSEERLDRTI